jgi:hypothetical protein
MTGYAASLRRIVFAAVFALLCTSEARAATTSLLITGDQGDYISGGQLLFFTPADGPFVARKNFGNGVSISFNTPTFDHFWHLDFAAANNQFLTPGVYTNAARFPFSTGQNGLSVFGDGRGCNTSIGSFEIKEIAYGGGDTILSFRATFEQHCEGFAPAARGEVRYNATVPIELSAPTHVSVNEGQPLVFVTTASDIIGEHVTLTAGFLPAGATFTDNGNNSGTFAWTPAGGQAGVYTVSFSGTNSRGDRETTYSQIRVAPTAPVNDEFSAPIVIADLPFTSTESTALAGRAADDPFCAGAGHTVWYSFTPPSDMRIEANTFGSDFDTTLSVYTGARGSLGQIACNDNSKGVSQSRVRFDAVAGTTYYFMVGSYFGLPGGRLVFNVLPAPPPLAIGLTIAGFGLVTPSTGDTIVIGALTCSRPVMVKIDGTVKQDRGQDAVIGNFATLAECDETTDWTAWVLVPVKLFEGRAAALLTGGKAAVTATARAIDDDTGEVIRSNAATSIMLRGSR